MLEEKQVKHLATKRTILPCIPGGLSGIQVGFPYRPLPTALSPAQRSRRRCHNYRATHHAAGTASSAAHGPIWRIDSASARRRVLASWLTRFFPSHLVSKQNGPFHSYLVLYPGIRLMSEQVPVLLTQALQECQRQCNAILREAAHDGLTRLKPQISVTKAKLPADWRDRGCQILEENSEKQYKIWASNDPIPLMNSTEEEDKTTFYEALTSNVGIKSLNPVRRKKNKVTRTRRNYGLWRRRKRRRKSVASAAGDLLENDTGLKVDESLLRCIEGSFFHTFQKQARIPK